jgi:hypothetical protein
MTYIENVKANIANYEAMLPLNAAPKFHLYLLHPEAVVVI